MVAEVGKELWGGSGDGLDQILVCINRILSGEKTKRKGEKERNARKMKAIGVDRICFVLLLHVVSKEMLNLNFL